MRLILATVTSTQNPSAEIRWCALVSRHKSQIHDIWYIELLYCVNFVVYKLYYSFCCVLFHKLLFVSRHNMIDSARECSQCHTYLPVTFLWLKSYQAIALKDSNYVRQFVVLVWRNAFEKKLGVPKTEQLRSSCAWFTNCAVHNQTHSTFWHNEYWRKIPANINPQGRHMVSWNFDLIVPVRACRIFDSKPLPEPMLISC